MIEKPRLILFFAKNVVKRGNAIDSILESKIDLTSPSIKDGQSLEISPFEESLLDPDVLALKMSLHSFFIVDDIALNLAIANDSNIFEVLAKYTGATVDVLFFHESLFKHPYFWMQTTSRIHSLESIRKNSVVIGEITPNSKDQMGGKIEFDFVLRNKYGCVEFSEVDFLNVQSMVRLKSEFLRLEFISNLDPLTQLHNRRGLQKFVENEISRSQRYQHFLSFVMMDLDGFKKLNDAQGHPKGDSILVKLSHEIESLLRGEDFLARLGGDEFAIVLPETSAKDAFKMTERIRAALNKNFSQEGITMSFGIASFPDHGDTFDTLYTKADQALYQSKNLGKNKTSVFNER